MIDLYSKDTNNQLRIWTIEPEACGFTITWGLVNGAKIAKTEFVKTNRSGRSIEEQVALQVAARVSKQLDKGYVYSMNEAKEQKKSNALFLPRPMLALPLNKVTGLNFDQAFIQRKYDGNRCMIANINGSLIAYTRSGKEITTIKHILDDIKIPKGAILDGELYSHGERLQTIASWVKKNYPETKKLKYHLYDSIDDKPFPSRYDQLLSWSYGPAIEIVPTVAILSQEEAIEHFHNFKDEGYEGAILRWGNLGYEDSKRSKHLAKIKTCHDKEFKVIDIITSKDGWGILQLELPNNASFKVVAPGTHAEKTKVAEYPWEYMGRHVTVEYASITADGIPFHGVAKCWRD